MATPNTIQETTVPVDLTAAEKLGNQLIGDSDLALHRLLNAVTVSFRALWGTQENPSEVTEAQAVLDALGPALVGTLFGRHAAMVAFLEDSGMATFEAWEKVPAYDYTVDGTTGALTLGTLNTEWAS